MAPTTRSSIRQSLGKAIADVINKEGKDGDKATKKIKETRRLSAINLKPAAPRNSMGEVKPLPQPFRRTGTPESSVLTRKRLSAVVHRPPSDEQSSSKASDNTPVTRSATLRPSSRLNTNSALPKYRPKTAVPEIVKQPPSPARAGTRRRLRASDDEKEDRPVSKELLDAAPSSSERSSRPISPLPNRALRKGPSVKSLSPPQTPQRKSFIPSGAKASPTLPSRPPKAVKTATSSTAPQAHHVPRPPSSSSSSSGTPRTPKTTPKTTPTKIITRRSECDRTSDRRSTPSSSPRRSETNSALARPPPQQQQRKVANPTHGGPIFGDMSHISEVTSEEEDVALLLAPVADPTAPTPAMPRLNKSRTREKQLPATPVRPNNMLPSRAQMSYLSPLPPGESSSFLRPPAQKPSGDDRILRGSILSWEQLATEASKTLGEDEVDSMLADVPAPFTPAPISPSISSIGLDLPDSPSLSVLNSPGAFGSISHVLLPDTTPSPAVHGGTIKHDTNNDLRAIDGAIVTLLRLQLIAAENTAKERLTRLQMMEEEVHNLKEEHRRETSELSMHISRMQEQLCEKVEDDERLAVERAAHTASLEKQLRGVQAARERTIRDEIAQYKQSERESRKAEIRARHVVGEATCAARVAQADWCSVRDLSEAELETVKGDRQLLSVVLAELGRMALLVQ